MGQAAKLPARSCRDLRTTRPEVNRSRRVAPPRRASWPPSATYASGPSLLLLGTRC